MSYKTLLFKHEYEVVDKKTLPSLSSEEVGHILLTIEQIPMFEEKEIVPKQFPEKFRSIINETRLDLTFIYSLKTPQYDTSFKKIIGFQVDDNKQKIDIVSFFTKIKDSKSEFRIYQIGGRYSEATEDAREFGRGLKNKTKEEVLSLLEEIVKSKEFRKSHPANKFYYLNKLRESYRQINNDKRYWKIQREIEKNEGNRMNFLRMVKEDLKIDENPFNISLEKFSFLKDDKIRTPRTKSIVYKAKYSEGKRIPKLTIQEIGNLLIEYKMIPHYLDFEEVKHQVNFRNIKEGTRIDITYHYAHIVPIFGDDVDERGFLRAIGREITGKIIKVDNVSFFTNVKNGVCEHRIYQIGARYEAKDLTTNDISGLKALRN